MQKKNFKNLTISFILIISTILMPLSFIPQKVEAQSIGGYASGMAVDIALLPQCKDVRLNALRGLFNGMANLLQSPAISDFGGQVEDFFSSPVEKLGSTLSSALSLTSAIDVNLPETTEKKLDTIQKNTEETKKSTASINENSSCIQSIGRLMIKIVLQKITQSTVNWINSGFDGSPSFIQDPEKFFNDIAKNEILNLGGEISDPALFPFTKAWMKRTATAFNNKIQDNAEYSLNKMIEDTSPGSSALMFEQDFSQGGWDAWSAMTQVPANNPLGFDLMVNNEMAGRLNGTVQTVAQNTRDALQAANGFLGDMRCSSPKDVTQQEDSRALKGEAGARKCEGGFQYVTPGAMIADKATEVLGYQNNAYLNVTDLNDAVAAIADALLAQFSSNFMEKGFADTQNYDFGTLSFPPSSRLANSYKSTTEKDFLPIHLSGSWLSANPDFNIRTDLTQALIDEQRTWSDKLAQQNKELNSTTDGQLYKVDAIDYNFRNYNFRDETNTKISNAYGLIPVIYQLDYCIPGPHPGWEEDALKIINTTLRKQPEYLSIFQNWYSSFIYKTFFSDREILPPITKEATSNFNKIKGYNQIIKINEGKMYAFRSVINMLGVIKKEVDALNSKLSYAETHEGKDINGNFFTEIDYEDALRTQINELGRLSASMVSGDDIMTVDNLTRQMIDEKNYIYKDLLKGDYGCEATLEDTYPKPYPWPVTNMSDTKYNVNTFKRPTYKSDLPILYDYATIKKGSPIPDPLKSGNTERKMEIPSGSSGWYSSDSNGSKGFWFTENDSGTWTTWNGTGGLGEATWVGTAGNGSGTWTSGGSTGYWNNGKGAGGIGTGTWPLFSIHTSGIYDQGFLPYWYFPQSVDQINANNNTFLPPYPPSLNSRDLETGSRYTDPLRGDAFEKAVGIY